MHAHRVEVFYRADDDAIVLAVAHHLHLIFFPAEQRLLNQKFMRGRGFQPTLADGNEFIAVIRDAAARSAHGERRPDNRREAQCRLYLQGLFQAMGYRRAR